MMTRTFVLLFVLSSVSYGHAQSSSQQIADTIVALPEALRDGATVLAVDTDGSRRVLRQGTNNMICEADKPGDTSFHARCYPKSHEEYRRRDLELASQGKNGDERRAIIAEEIESGKIEWPDAVVEYNLVGLAAENAMTMTIVYLPHATGESTGLSEERDNHRPWLMRANTPFAHIMIPGK